MKTNIILTDSQWTLDIFWESLAWQVKAAQWLWHRGSSQNSPYDLTGFYQPIVQSAQWWCFKFSIYISTLHNTQPRLRQLLIVWCEGGGGRGRGERSILSPGRDPGPRLSLSVLMCQWCLSSHWATGARAHTNSPVRRNTTTSCCCQVMWMNLSPVSANHSPGAGRPDQWEARTGELVTVCQTGETPPASAPSVACLMVGWAAGSMIFILTTPTSPLLSSQHQQLQHFHQQHQLSPGSWERATRPGLHDLSVRLQPWQRQHFSAKRELESCPLESCCWFKHPQFVLGRGSEHTVSWQHSVSCSPLSIRTRGSEALILITTQQIFENQSMWPIKGCKLYCP